MHTVKKLSNCDYADSENLFFSIFYKLADFGFSSLCLNQKTCVEYYGGGTTLIGVVGATTAKAMRFAQQARTFISGSAVPDWVIFDETVLEMGLAAVRAAGYFTNDWSLTR